MRRRDFITGGLVALGAAGCSPDEESEPASRAADGGTRTPTPTSEATPTPSPTQSLTRTPTTTPTPTPSPTPRGSRQFVAADALETVRLLAGRIGPREATSRAYRRAADLVEDRFGSAGYDVGRQRLDVPAGVSWGFRVPSGTTTNLIARPPGFDPEAEHLVVGAHLDTVPPAPGAEDNASGVAVVLEVARLSILDPPPLPVLFMAFGAEEPRGDGDDWHHFGSRYYVGRLSARERQAVRGMVSLDRVGVGASVRVRTGGRAPESVADALESVASRVDVPVERGSNRASDHWSFEKAGIPAARLGGHPYAGYHNANDRPAIVSGAALTRTARLLWAYLSTDRR